MRRQWLFAFSISPKFVALIWTIVVFWLLRLSCSHRLVLFFLCCSFLVVCYFITVSNDWQCTAMVWSCRSALFQLCRLLLFFCVASFFSCVQLDLWRNAVARTMCINWSKKCVRSDIDQNWRKVKKVKRRKSRSQFDIAVCARASYGD